MIKQNETKQKKKEKKKQQKPDEWICMGGDLFFSLPAGKKIKCYCNLIGTYFQITHLAQSRIWTSGS